MRVGAHAVRPVTGNEPDPVSFAGRLELDAECPRSPSSISTGGPEQLLAIQRSRPPGTARGPCSAGLCARCRNVVSVLGACGCHGCHLIAVLAIRGDAMEIACVLCGHLAVGEVDVAAGLPAGLCAEHMDRWLSKHPELRVEQEASR